MKSEFTFKVRQSFLGFGLQDPPATPMRLLLFFLLISSVANADEIYTIEQDGKEIDVTSGWACKSPEIKNGLVKINCSTADGPVFYFDEKTRKLIAECSIWRVDPTNCPPKEWSDQGESCNPLSCYGPPENKNDEGSVGSFRAILLMTTDVQQVLENWSNPTQGVYIPSTDRVARGQPIEALVVFSGCAADTLGNCVSEIDYRVTKPDGSLHAEYKNTELWRNRPAIPEGRIGLAMDRVGLVATPTDPLGTYRVECIVRDLVANVEFVVSSSYTVTETKRLDGDGDGVPCESICR